MSILINSSNYQKAHRSCSYMCGLRTAEWFKFFLLPYEHKKAWNQRLSVPRSEALAIAHHC